MTHMKTTYLVLPFILAFSLWQRPPAKGQNKAMVAFWQEELSRARAHIQQEPRSAYWHNQAGLAYGSLGETSKAQTELTLAAKLDPENPIGYWTLFAFYQRNGRLSQQRKALLRTLEIDSRNPLGHFELAIVLEKEGHLKDSLREYQAANRLVSTVAGGEYTDQRGNPFEVNVVRKQVRDCIARVKKEMSQRKADK